MFESLISQSTVIPHSGFAPFPKAADRAAWNALPDGLTKAMVAAGERYLDYKWPLVRLTDYVEYAESGNRSRHAERYFARRHAVGTLATAECAEGEGRFVRDLIDGLWLICEETSWVIPAHESDASRTPGPLPSRHIDDQGIDLFAAETGALLSWVSYLLGERLSDEYPEVYERIRYEVGVRVVDQFLDRNDQWWMGIEESRHDYLNNWTPWCVTNCLAAFLLVEGDDGKRRAGLIKAAGCLDRYLDLQPADGGCDEGPGYWMAAAGALCDALELLKLGTGGAVDGFGEPHVREMAGYLWRVHIGRRWFVNFGDGNALLTPPPELLYRFGKRVGDEVLSTLGLSYFSKDCTDLVGGAARWYPFLRQLSAYFTYDEMAIARDRAPAIEELELASSYDTRFDNRRVTWLPDSEIFVVAGGDLFLGAKGAHNGESHNHNDVGQFVLFSRGEPFLVDAGVTEYTRKTFSPQRYEIWAMQSAYHNLPQIAGFDQQAGKEFRAHNCRVTESDGSHALEMELQNAYAPEAPVIQWRRRITFVPVANNGEGETDSVVLSESFELDNAGVDLVLHLISPWEPDITAGDGGPGIVTLTTNSGNTLSFNFPEALVADYEVVSFDDSRLKDVWGTTLYRISLSQQAAETTGNWEIRFVPGTGQ